MLLLYVLCVDECLMLLPMESYLIHDFNLFLIKNGNTKYFLTKRKDELQSLVLPPNPIDNQLACLCYKNRTDCGVRIQVDVSALSNTDILKILKVSAK